MGLIFPVLGIFAAYRFWRYYEAISVLLLLVSCYQLVSLLFMFKEVKWEKRKNKYTIILNMLSSITIAVFFVLSLIML